MGYLAEHAVFMPLTKIVLEESDKFTCGNEDLIYPAVLIGRLGISTKYQKHHIGTELMNFIKSWFVDSSNDTNIYV